MKHFYIKKCISFSIATVFLANQCLLLHAGNSTRNKRLNTQVQQRVETARRSSSYSIARGAQLANANCDVGTVKCVLNFLKPATQAKDPEKATICVPASKRDTKNKVCINAAAFAHGAIHVAVSDSKNSWLYYNHKQTKVLGSDKTYIVKTAPFPIREVAPDVFELVAQWGTYYDSDIDALSKYFKGVVTPSTCGKKDANTCHEEMAALIGLAFLATQQNSTAKKAARKTATKILKNKWKSDDGGIVIKGAIAALGVLNSQAAWADIDTFVTKTSLPNVIYDAMGLMSVEGIADLGISLNSAGYASTSQYYNTSNRRFTYLDTLAAQKQGFKYPYNNPAFQYPNNNVFEEIGYFIGREAAEGNKSAQKLANKILNSAIRYAKNKTTPPTPFKQRIVTTGGAGPAIPAPDTRKFEIYGGHWPVVVGIMDGATSANRPWSITPNRNGVFHLIQHVFNKGFWDLNAGTYARVFNIAMAYGDALTKQGTFPRMSKQSKGYLITEKRYKKITQIRTLSYQADMAIFAVSAFLSFASLSEVLSSIYKTGRWLKKQVSSVKKIMKYSRRVATRVPRATATTISAAATGRATTQTAVRRVRAAAAAGTITGTKVATTDSKKAKKRTNIKDKNTKPR